MPLLDQRLDILLAAPVQHADGHRIAAHGFDDAAVGLELRRLVGHGFAVHEQEFGAEQADPHRAGLGDQRQLDRDFQIGLQLHRLAVQRFGRQAAQPAEALAFPREGRDGAPRRGQRGGGRVQHDAAGAAVDDRDIAGTDRLHQAGHAQHGGHAERPQHHRGMPVRAAFVGGDTRQPRGIEQRRIGRAQGFGNQDGAFGQAGETAERRARQVAHQPAADLAHFIGTALQAGALVAGVRAGDLRQNDLGDRFGFRHHRAFRRQQRFRDPPACAADQAGGADHLDIAIDQRADLGLALFRQHGQPAAQLGELLARLQNGCVQPDAFRGDVGGLDLGLGDLGGCFGGAEHRADGNAGGNRDAGEELLRPRPGGGPGGTAQAFVLRRRRQAGRYRRVVSPVHGSRPRPVRPRLRWLPWRPSPPRAAVSSSPGPRPASSGP